MSKLQLRLPDTVHNKIRKIAKREKVSINQILVNSISNEIIRDETFHFFSDRAKDFNEQDFVDALQEIPGIEPEKQDKI